MSYLSYMRNIYPKIKKTIRFEPLTTFLDYFLPTKIKKGNEEELLRSRLFIVATFAMSVSGGFYAFQNYELEGLNSIMTWIGLLTGILFFINPFCLRIFQSIKYAGVAIALELITILTCVAYFSGGFISSAFYWFPIIPFIAVFGGNSIWALFIGIFSTIIVGCFYFMSLNHIPFPQIYSADEMQLFNLLSLSSALILIAFLVWFHDMAYKHTLKLLNKNMQKIQQIYDEKNKMEIQLRQASMLSAVGQLAAGVAHEINTPLQYIRDNIGFVKKSFEVLASPAQDENSGALRKEALLALESSLEGASSVTKIVQSLREFSHPDTGVKEKIDLNATIENTIKVAQNEWKYVAELKTNFDPTLPLVSCFPGEINQVILNLIINAAQAIAAHHTVSDLHWNLSHSRDVNVHQTLSHSHHVNAQAAKALAVHAPANPSAELKGTIYIETKNLKNHVEIRVQDTGVGIPEEIQPNIFVPFFTTKPIGMGTGQGLAIAHAIVVEKHKGSIRFETQVNKGSTFIVRLPI